MNKIYKTIRNRKNGSMVVVSELAKGNKKSLTSKLLALAVSAMLLTTTTAMAATIIDVTENNQVISTHYDSTTDDPLMIKFSDPNYTLIFKDISPNAAIKSDNSGITLQVNGDSSKAGGNLIFQNNKNTGYGGAIYVGGKLNLSSLNSISFIGNTVSKDDKPKAYGGGIYSYSKSDSSVYLGNNARFNDNIAGVNSNGYGGGVYSSASDSSSVTLGDNATFTGNIAGNDGTGYGGGVYSYSASASASTSVTLGDNATFTENIAGNDGVGYGGGVYSSSTSDSSATATASSSVTLGDSATFTGNIAGNKVEGFGGGIYSYSKSTSSSVTLGDNATFTGNIAGNDCYGFGGGIAAKSASSSSSSSVMLGDNAIFTGNIAGKNSYGYGGGIFSNSYSSSSSSVMLGDNATFTGNIAGNDGYGYGGGIFSKSHSKSSSTSVTVMLGRGAYFSSNRAGNGSATTETSYGGAIYSSNYVSLNGNSFFVGNLVGKAKDSQGGAIYIDGLGTQNTAKLNADVGAIAFKNNYVNVEKDATEGDSNSIYLNQNTILELTGNGNIYFDDPIDSGENGNNSLVKTGAGFVQFNGKNYLNTAGGKSVDIQEGTFRVVTDASFKTSSDGVFKVAEGATLAGGGTITAKEFTISGNISIDGDKFEVPEYDTVSHTFRTENTKIKNSKQTGTLTLEGNVIFDSSTRFNVKVNPADKTKNDLLTVEGKVDLNDATVRNIGYYGAKPNRSLENRTWKILEATESIEGEFSGVESVYAMLTGEVEKASDNKSVTLTLTRTSSFDSFSQTYNQNSIVGALESLDSSSLVYGSITNIIGDDNSVREAYDSLSGEIHAGLHGALMDGDRHFASTMLDRLSGREFKKAMNNEVVTDKLDGQNYFWITSNGFRSETDKTKGNAKAVFNGGGLTMGGESERDNLTVGGAFHYGHSDYKLDSRNSKADIDSFKVAGYGAYQMDSWRFKAGASYGFHQIDSKRYVSVTDEHVKIDYDMHTVQLFGEIANSFNFNLANSHQAVIEPYIGLGWNLSHSESFKEKGGNAALNSKAKSNGNVNSTIGSRFFYKPTATVSLGADLNWQHIYGGRHTESESTIDGSDRFTIQGARLDRDSFGAKFDTSIQITPTVNLKAGYQGRFGNSSYNGGFVSTEVKF